MRDRSHGVFKVTRRAESVTRHDLVWIEVDRPTGRLRPVPRELQAVVQDWVVRGRPFIVTRRPPGLPPDRCALGLPLPVRLGRRRVALQVVSTAIRKVCRPPALHQVAQTAPTRLRQALRDLDDLGQRQGIVFHSYGSFAWQFLTGETYVTRDSDLDLLCWPRALAGLERAGAILAAWEDRWGIRADGEFLLPGGDAMSWREWVQKPRKVLLKRIDGVTMAPIADVANAFRPGTSCTAH